jgi:hypothetical protein
MPPAATIPNRGSPGTPVSLRLLHAGGLVRPYGAIVSPMTAKALMPEPAPLSDAWSWLENARGGDAPVIHVTARGSGRNCAERALAMSSARVHILQRDCCWISVAVDSQQAATRIGTLKEMGSATGTYWMRSGYPVRGASRSVTVAGSNCLESGLLATLAMLHGPEAETFLAGQGVRFWCLR